MAQGEWDKTGSVVEVRQFDQYVVRVDGSGRMTLRNRKFPRKYVPVIPRPPRRTIDEDLHRHNLYYETRPTYKKSSAICTHLPLPATGGGGNILDPDTTVSWLPIN